MTMVMMKPSQEQRHRHHQRLDALEENGDVFAVDVVTVIEDVRLQHHLQHHRHCKKRSIERNDNDNNNNNNIDSKYQQQQTATIL